MKNIKPFHILFTFVPAMVQLLLYNKLYGVSGGDLLVDLIVFILIIIELTVAMTVMKKTLFFKQAIVAIITAIVFCICIFYYWNQHLENEWEKKHESISSKF